MSIPNALGLFLLLYAATTFIFVGMLAEKGEARIAHFVALWLSLLLSLGAYLILL